jgi:hypothetical protein
MNEAMAHHGQPRFVLRMPCDSPLSRAMLKGAQIQVWSLVRTVPTGLSEGWMLAVDFFTVETIWL